MFHAYVCNLFLTFAGNKLRLADWEQNCLPRLLYFTERKTET